MEESSPLQKSKYFSGTPDICNSFRLQVKVIILFNVAGAGAE